MSETIRIRCTRQHCEKTAAEHRDCPYCFGQTREVESGEHERFCSFEPGKDPVSFGFPEGTMRERKG